MAIKLTPKETQQHELPDKAGALIMVNETIASVDFDIELNDGILKFTVLGIYIGKTEDAPQNLQKKKWQLS